MDEATVAIVHVRVDRAGEELRATRRLIEDGLYRIAWPTRNGSFLDWKRICGKPAR